MDAFRIKSSELTLFSRLEDGVIYDPEGPLAFEVPSDIIYGDQADLSGCFQGESRAMGSHDYVDAVNRMECFNVGLG